MSSNSGDSSSTFSGTHGDSEQPGDSPRTFPYVVLVLQAERPLAPLARIPLGGLAALHLGRGRVQAISARGAGPYRKLSLPDRRLSSDHARLVSSAKAWFVEDSGSKNRTWVNGEAVDRRVLRDGDVIEAGGAFLLYRDRAAIGEPELDSNDLDTSAMEDLHRGLRTLCPDLQLEYQHLERAARSDKAILIRGETGTGKELTARAVHALSGRGGEFVAVNCGALPEQLVASELFGHLKGAFSGADEGRTGWVRAAHGGTLLLDEIAELSESSQVALLRVLQEREVVPVGATRPVPVDTRFVAATHQNLEARISCGRFRQDLAARLRQFEVVLPPLRQRREDLGLLIAARLKSEAGERAANVRFRLSAARALFRYHWPDNIRELQNAIGSALILTDGDVIAPEHLPAAVHRTVRERRADQVVAANDPELLRARLVDLLRQHRGNVSAVARALGKDRKQIRRWCARFNVDCGEFRE